MRAFDSLLAHGVPQPGQEDRRLVVARQRLEELYRYYQKWDSVVAKHIKEALDALEGK